MKSSPGLFILFFLMAAVLVPTGRVQAQLSIPRFDVELKGMQTIYPGKGDEGAGVEVSEFTAYYAAMHIQINQNIGIGPFYARSFRGTIHYSNKLSPDNQVREAEQQYTGLDLRISTGRTSRWRPYLSLRYGKAEIVEQRDGYRVAGKSNNMGASLGLMRRLGSKVYLTVIELGMNQLSDKLFWSDAQTSLEGKMGVLVNFGKKK